MCFTVDFQKDKVIVHRIDTKTKTNIIESWSSFELGSEHEI